MGSSENSSHCYEDEIVLAKKFNSKEGEVEEFLELSDLEKLEEAEVEGMLVGTPETFHSECLFEEFAELEVLE